MMMLMTFQFDHQHDKPVVGSMRRMGAAVAHGWPRED
jgi:hypothetical protein